MIYFISTTTVQQLTSISVWKEKRSTCCQLLPSRAIWFQYLDTRAHRQRLGTSRYENTLQN